MRHFVDGCGRDRQRRATSRHGPDDSDATVFQPERNDRPGRKSEPNECARNARAEPFRNFDDCQDAQADAQWKEISIAEMSQKQHAPSHRSVLMRQPEHAWQLRDQNVNRDAGEKARRHRNR